MTREIKIRAWVKPLERYAKGIDTILYHKACDVEGGGIWSVVCKEWVSEVYECDDIIIEQYSGLKDKNGKEIYEGDIMRYDAIDYQVLWEDYYADFETKRLNSPWNNEGLTLHFLARVGRVIGNVHENPELLGGEE